MEKQKKEEKNEFVDLMIKKAFSEDPKVEPYVSKITTNKDPELKPHQDSVNIEQIEELTQRIKSEIATKKSQPK